MEGKPSGVVRSVDGGRTWEAFGESPRLRDVRTLTFHPKTGTLLLGTFSEGVLESPDLGKTLRVRSEGLAADFVCSIAVDPKNGERLFVGMRLGLFRSDDGGLNWTWASKGITGLQSVDLHVLPGNRVLLFEFQQGVRISTDGGRTWPAFTPGWKKTYGQPFWAAVRGDVVAVNTGYGARDAAVSRDAGRTWARSEISKEEWILGVVGPKCIIGARHDGTLLRSRDGIEFEKIADPPKALPGVMARIYPLAGDQVVILSSTHAAPFDPATGEVGTASPLPEGGRSDRAVVDPGDPSVLWLGTRSGCLYRRAFFDGAWTCPVDRSGGPLTGLVGDPARARRRIACFADGTLLLSENAGLDWVPLESPPRFRRAVAMAVTSDRRLLLVADGSVRVLDLVSLDE